MLTFLSSKTATGQSRARKQAGTSSPFSHPPRSRPRPRNRTMKPLPNNPAQPLNQNPGAVTDHSPGQVRVCERVVLGKRPMTSSADSDAARQRETDLRLIPSLNLCLPGSRNHSPNHRLSSQKTSLNKFPQVPHKAGTSLAQGQNKVKQAKTSLNKSFYNKLFFTANSTSPKLTLTLMLSLNPFTTNNVKSSSQNVKGCVKS